MKGNLYLIGFSGSGKSTVGRDVARALGWTFIDTDEEITRRSGADIDAIFTDIGEEGFREVEHEVLREIAGGRHQVVSTGGGIVTGERNRHLMSETGVVVCLEARPETISDRVDNGTKEPVRPMLDPDHQGRQIHELKAERQHLYALADWTVHTDRLTPASVADEVIRALRTLSADDHSEFETGGTGELAAVVRTGSGDYPIWVGFDGLGAIGERARTLVDPGVAYVIADEGSSRHARRAQAALEASGIAAHIFIIPAGENNKTLQTVELVYRWLAGRRAERGHLIVAVGGGVVGDLAGYVAATYLRGLPFVQVPTTLLAMVDASVGGKTGVDLRQGKNLVGAFHQPRFVLADVATLKTLTPRTLTEGWAEVLKHALALDEGLLVEMERDADGLRALDPELATDLIRRSVAIKANLVSRDERETLGIRMLLNYGHTIGHALESTTGYGRFLHGEAVSIGMAAAGQLSVELGMLTSAELARQRAVLEAYGLPVSASGVNIDELKAATLSDKKVRHGSNRWVLLNGLGNAVVRTDVPDGAVDTAIRAVVTN
jgi:shikimate kinase/3-dehydroquinate synthase